MTGHLIDLTQVEFWLACMAGLVVLVPLGRAAPRRWAQAAINVGFIAALLGAAVLPLVVAIVAVHAILRAVAGPHRAVFSAGAGAAVAAAFVLNKLPWLADSFGGSAVSSSLSAIGFSYVALRMVEVIRAVFERRQQPPDLASTINYLLPFHMLAAGPIQTYDEFVSQPAVPAPLTRADALAAIERITTGLFKKFVLAFALQELFLTDFQTGGIYFLLEVQVFFLWLFLDFSAYTDIAVGVGRLLGIATPENFDRPYLARNAIDFWERWHITLSMFIRRNVFIPIQLALARRNGGRRPLLSASIAFTIAFVLCGLWHGLTINFLLWGAFHAAGLVIANIYRQTLRRRLGARGVREYMADRRKLWAARFVTYEFVAFSLVLLFHP